MDKKRIAFFQEDLGPGGIQKSLFNLLRNLDYDRVDAELFLVLSDFPEQLAGLLRHAQTTGGFTALHVRVALVVVDLKVHTVSFQFHDLDSVQHLTADID